MKLADLHSIKAVSKTEQRTVMMTTLDLQRPLAIDIDDHDVVTLRHEGAIHDGKGAVEQMCFDHGRAADHDKEGRGASSPMRAYRCVLSFISTHIFSGTGNDASQDALFNDIT